MPNYSNVGDAVRPKLTRLAFPMAESLHTCSPPPKIRHAVIRAALIFLPFFAAGSTHTSCLLGLPKLSARRDEPRQSRPESRPLGGDDEQAPDLWRGGPPEELGEYRRDEGGVTWSTESPTALSPSS